jgi:hypothetical protein
MRSHQCDAPTAKGVCGRPATHFDAPTREWICATHAKRRDRWRLRQAQQQAQQQPHPPASDPQQQELFGN